jgi:hypothetical protein
MNKFFCKCRTVRDLGFLNLVRVLLYRLHLRLGLNKAQKTKENMPAGLFFGTCKRQINSNLSISPNWRESGLLFSHLSIPLDDTPPDWSLNPLTGQKFRDWQSPWWRIPDFDKNVGDIKVIWELSRFEWVLAFSQFACTGDEKAVSKINDWLTDWCKHNPAFLGPNWKCGQEASIRVMHLAMAALILEQSAKPSESLRRLILIHLERINPTTIYAIAQCNNHATSEAAALFIGGILVGGKEGEKFSSLGRKLLERQVERLVSEDGSFSQYSLNYHRVFLDTVCMVEIWRQKKGEKEFSSAFYNKAREASTWLFNLIDLTNGDGPNVGANDGARLFCLNNTKYRDYRPTVQMAYNLFYNKRAIKETGSWDEGLKWMELAKYKKCATQQNSFIADEGGFAVLRNNKAWVLLKYPRYKFRPSHADALHVDFWVNGLNLLKDGGTYSYNTDAKWINYFSGTESHNTIQFDGNDQMPKVSRFLFGDWLKTSKLQPLELSNELISYGAGYRSGKSLTHFRSISIDDQKLLVLDRIDGFKEKAVLRWRLPFGRWEIEKCSSKLFLINDQLTNFVISVSTEDQAKFYRTEIVVGWESLHYMEKTNVSVLEVEVSEACELSTEVIWAD